MNPLFSNMKIKVTLIQPVIEWENIQSNLEHLDHMLKAILGKTDLILLPELFSTGFTMNTSVLSENMEGNTTLWMLKQATFLKAVIAGSIIIKENQSLYNRLIWTYPDGKIQYYDKRHLFRMGRENAYYSPGRKKTVMNISEWRILPLICYDLRFPVWSRNTGIYDLLIYIANWPAGRREVWKTLLRARAIENQCFVIGVNRVGMDGNKLEYAGDSMVVDYKGNVIFEMEPHTESQLTCELDLMELKDFREKFPVHLDADEFSLQ